jgi:3-hydroxyisobutyrate dehydrogenase
MSSTEFGKVAFVGIGHMGWPMATRLVDAGFRVAVFDVDTDRAARFALETGANAAESLESVAESAEVVITMLPKSEHVRSVVSTIRPVLKSGALVIDMTSGLPSITQDISADLISAGVEMIDAPVSGGVPRARSGELAIMVGGPKESIDRAKPLLSVLGSTVTEVGKIGAGQAMKALNNLVSAGGFLIGVEALIIGRKFGLDPGKMVDVLNASTGVNNSTQKKFHQFVLSRTFSSNFGLDLMAKDLAIALAVAGDGGVTVPFARFCSELWADAAGTLGPGKDHTEMARFCEVTADFSLGQDIEEGSEPAV